MSNEVYLAIGSNFGEKQRNFDHAHELLAEKFRIIKIAQAIVSKAMYFEDQPDFWNSAIYGETELNPQELLFFLKQIEKKVGRIERFTNGPREIDLDIIFYNDLILNEIDLIIPHPRIQERGFVLKPLSELNPNLFHPVLKKTVKELLSLL